MVLDNFSTAPLVKVERFFLFVAERFSHFRIFASKRKRERAKEKKEKNKEKKFIVNSFLLT